MKKYSLYALTIVFAVSLTGCGGGENYTIEEVGGIRFIHNLSPQWGGKPKVELEYIRTIGGLNETDENYQMFRTADALKDTEGNLYILDSGNNRLQKFGPDGRYLLTIGRGEGQGPGEFNMATSIVIDNEDNINIMNVGNRRIDKFSSTGVFMSSTEARKMYTFFRFLSDGNLVAPVLNIPEPGQEEAEAEKTLVSIIDSKGEIVRSFGKFKEYDDMMMNMMGNIVRIAVDGADNIYAAYGTENLVEKYNTAGELILKIDRPLPYEIVHKTSIREFDFNGQKTEMPFPEMTYVSLSVEIDSHDRVWVATYHEQPVLPAEGQIGQTLEQPGGFHFEIYDSGGIWLGNIEQPEEGLTLVRIQGDTVFFVSKDLVAIYEYRIVENNN